MYQFKFYIKISNKFYVEFFEIFPTPNKKKRMVQ